MSGNCALQKSGTKESTKTFDDENIKMKLKNY